MVRETQRYSVDLSTGLWVCVVQVDAANTIMVSVEGLMGNGWF